MYYIGLMSGTSMDAVDVALVDMTGQSLEIIAFDQFSLPEDIQQRLRSVDGASPLEEVSELDTIVATLFADGVERLLDRHNIDGRDIRAIGSHGQTVLHLPEDDLPRTLQIGDPGLIAVRTGITTVADFRSMDIAAGGQGAPLAPGFHGWFFTQRAERKAILNIGGMANLTVLDGDNITGFDSGPGNALMDDWIRLQKGKDFDRDGEWAASGQCHEVLLGHMTDYDYFRRTPPKSTGKDEFNMEWLNICVNDCNRDIAAKDIQATLLELSAVTISDAISRHAADITEIIVCGGGCHNRVLMDRLTRLMEGREIATTEKYGIHPDAVEAVAFAWLAKRRLDGEPGNVPAVTGASRPVVLGGVYEPMKSEK